MGVGLIRQHNVAGHHCLLHNFAAFGLVLTPKEISKSAVQFASVDDDVFRTASDGTSHLIIKFLAEMIG